MDRSDLRDNLLHYVLIVAIAYLSLQLAGQLAPDLVLWQEILLALGVTIAYIVAVIKLGYAPDSWIDG